MKKTLLPPNQNGFIKRPLSLVHYTKIMSEFCNGEKMEEAFAVFRMVKDYGVQMDEFVYAILVGGVCKRGDFEVAFQLLAEMEKKGIPSNVTYNTLINGLCKIGRTTDADHFAKRMMLMPGDDDVVVVYSTLLNGYAQEGNVNGILDIKRRSEEAGVVMDTVMCNILIKALFVVGAFRDAHAVYKGMVQQEMKMDLVANSVTYCTMIDGYCKLGRIDEALEIFDELRTTSFSSSVPCYNCIITGLCNTGMVDVATEVFIELCEKGMTLDLGIYMKLIKGIVKDNNSAPGVLNLIYRIEKLGLDGFDSMCNDAINLLCKRKFPVTASEVYMVARRNQSTLTSKTYYSIIKGLIGEGKIQLSQPFLCNLVKECGLVEPKASKVLLHYLCLKDINNALHFHNKMREKNVAITFPVSALRTLAKKGRAFAVYEVIMKAEDLPVMGVADYSIIIDGLCKEGHLLKGLDLCVFAEKKGIKLNIITHNSVINGLCRQGCLFEAFQIFDSLERIDLIPSTITYATLIDSVCKEGHLLDAKQLFERMVLNGHEVNTRIYNSLLNGYCKFGKVEESLKIVDSIEMKCLDPDEFTVSAMLNGYCQKGDMEGALRFIFEYKGKDLSPDFLGFLHLIRGLCSKGRMEEARSILREMLQSQSVLELIKMVDAEVETESIESFLGFLCEQGSIREAATVLNEVASMFFPVQKCSGLYTKSIEPHKLPETEASGVVVPGAVSSSDRSDADCASCSVVNVGNMVGNSSYSCKQSHFNDFDSYYSVIASLCSRGELWEANRLVKKMVASLDGDC
uniref:Pentatricopeptide repeat-containing protein At5g57250-like n=1 Tax=Rhizophora mucronata TaxID=61149 RepID=A0A2P2LN12_RHIMU